MHTSNFNAYQESDGVAMDEIVSELHNRIEIEKNLVLLGVSECKCTKEKTNSFTQMKYYQH